MSTTEWLTKLAVEVTDRWERAGLRGHETSKTFSGRKITKEEFAIIKDTIKKLRLPTLLCSADYSFGAGIQIYDAPEYPGMMPTLLITVSTTNLEKGILPEREIGSENHMNKIWKIFQEITDSKQNMDLLLFYKMKYVKKESCEY